MTTVLVYGSNGQLGWELSKQLETLDIKVTALDLPKFDISDRHQVKSTVHQEKPDLIINAAAYTAVDKAENEREKAYKINADGPSFLAETCSEEGIPLIHVSTDYVFDGLKGKPYVEDDSVSPISVYGLSKEAGERAVRNTLDNHVIIRTSWVYGVHGHNFVKTMLHLGKENKMIKVVNDQFGCPTYAADLAETIVRVSEMILEKKTISWGAYHYCGGGITTWYDFAARIFEIAEQYITLKVTDLKPIPTSEYPTPAKRPPYSALNCDKIEKKFNIKQKPWDSSLERMLDVLFRDD